MNDNILCLYYSRTGNTKKAMEEVAEALDCECLEIRDKVERSGTMGFFFKIIVSGPGQKRSASL